MAGASYVTSVGKEQDIFVLSYQRGSAMTGNNFSQLDEVFTLRTDPIAQVPCHPKKRKRCHKMFPFVKIAENI